MYLVSSQSATWLLGPGQHTIRHVFFHVALRFSREDSLIPVLVPLHGNVAPFSTVMNCSSGVKSSVADPGYLSWILIFYPSRIPDLGSRSQIQDPGCNNSNKRGG